MDSGQAGQNGQCAMRLAESVLKVEKDNATIQHRNMVALTVSAAGSRQQSVLQIFHVQSMGSGRLGENGKCVPQNAARERIVVIDYVTGLLHNSGALTASGLRMKRVYAILL